MLWERKDRHQSQLRPIRGRPDADLVYARRRTRRGHCHEHDEDMDRLERRFPGRMPFREPGLEWRVRRHPEPQLRHAGCEHAGRAENALTDRGYNWEIQAGLQQRSFRLSLFPRPTRVAGMATCAPLRTLP